MSNSEHQLFWVKLDMTKLRDFCSGFSKTSKFPNIKPNFGVSWELI